MREIINNVRRFINMASPSMQGLIIGLLLIFILMVTVNVIKAFTGNKKVMYKVFQILLLAILIAFTIFVFSNL